MFIPIKKTTISGLTRGSHRGRLSSRSGHRGHRVRGQLVNGHPRQRFISLLPSFNNSSPSHHTTTSGRRRHPRATRRVRQQTTRIQRRRCKGRIRVAFRRAFRARFQAAMFTNTILRQLLTSTTRANLLNRCQGRAVRLAMSFSHLSSLTTMNFRTTIRIIGPSSQRNTNHPIRGLTKPTFTSQVMTLLLPTQGRVMSLFRSRPTRFKGLIKQVLRVNIRHSSSLPFHDHGATMRNHKFTMITNRPSTPRHQVLLFRKFSSTPQVIKQAIIRRSGFMNVTILHHRTISPYSRFKRQFHLIMRQRCGQCIRFVRLLLCDSCSPTYMSGNHKTHRDAPTVVEPGATPGDELARVPPRAITDARKTNTI